MPTKRRLAFICYRRSDSHAIAKFLYDHLSETLGSNRVFLAPETIGGGEEWPPAITTALDAAVVMIVLIGREWLTVQNKNDERLLDLPDDWVVREIREALERKIPIIPVLVGGSDLPSEEAMPSGIKKMLEYQARKISPAALQEQEDINQLLRELEKYIYPAIKGLYPYERSDVETFELLQRDDELEECLDTMTNPHVRVGVLRGGTGCGKTSFLQAGLIPALAHEKAYIGVYARFTHYGDPFAVLREAMLTNLKLPANLDRPDLPHWFKVATENHSPIVLLFDQFDEFFFHGDQHARDGFTEGLKRWYLDQHQLTLKILFSVHSGDALVPFLSGIGCSHPPQFNLAYFTRNQAFEVLKVLAERERMAFDDSFVKKTIICDLDPEGDGISPLELQILALAIRRHGGTDPSFTEASYELMGGIKGSLERLLDKELRPLPDPDQKIASWILEALIDRELRVRLSLTVEEIVSKLHMPKDKVNVELMLHSLVKAKLVWAAGQGTKRRYELAHKQLIDLVLEYVRKKFFRIELANLILDHHVQASDMEGRERLLRRKDYRLIKEVKSQDKLRWGTQQAREKELIKKSRNSLRIQGVLCFIVILGLAIPGYLYMPDTPQSLIRQNLRDVLDEKNPQRLPMETITRVIAALGEWEEWEKRVTRAKDHPEQLSKARADLGRSELSLLADKQKLWNKADERAQKIQNPELKAITFTDLAKELEESGDPEKRNEFVQHALNAVQHMPKNERAERVHVLYHLQSRATDPAQVRMVKDSLDAEAKEALAQIESRTKMLASPSQKELLQDSLRLREEVRLLAIAAQVESYAGDPAKTKEQLDQAQEKLEGITRDRDKSIAFHLLIQSAAACVITAADNRVGDFYKTYLTKLVKLLPESTSPIEYILGLIETSAIILRATPPAAAEKLASDFLDEAEVLASNLRRDNENKKQTSEKNVEPPASFLLREVRRLKLDYAELLSKYRVKQGNEQKDPPRHWLAIYKKA